MTRKYWGRPCSATGCHKQTIGHSKHCQTHRSVDRRWGHPLQAPMTKGELTRLSKHVTRLINSRPNSADLWCKLREALKQLKREARAVVAEIKPGFPVFDKEAGPNLIILQTLVDAEPDKVIAAMIAIGYVAGIDRHRFKNDDAYFMAAGRRLYLLSRAHFEGHINPATGKRHFVCKEPNSKNVLAVGRKMMAAFGAFGLRLALIEERDERHADDVRKAPLMALSSP
ncbi:MAG: hypothetical protein JNK83_00420 [Rhizobiales bacterium]|nr:hypothetical protein [Hyphomicrobiales bacterium]